MESWILNGKCPVTQNSFQCLFVCFCVCVFFCFYLQVVCHFQCVTFYNISHHIISSLRCYFYNVCLQTFPVLPHDPLVFIQFFCASSVPHHQCSLRVTTRTFVVHRITRCSTFEKRETQDNWVTCLCEYDFTHTPRSTRTFQMRFAEIFRKLVPRSLPFKFKFPRHRREWKLPPGCATVHFSGSGAATIFPTLACLAHAARRFDLISTRQTSFAGRRRIEVCLPCSSWGPPVSSVWWFSEICLRRVYMGDKRRRAGHSHSTEWGAFRWLVPMSAEL